MSITQARRSLGRAIQHYLYGAVAKGWNGAIASVYAFLGLATGNAVDPDNFSPPNFHTMLYVFAVAFAINMLQWLRDNPLPATLPDTNPPFDSVLNPPTHQTAP